jgi:YVTN family beta-propeller protein
MQAFPATPCHSSKRRLAIRVAPLAFAILLLPAALRAQTVTTTLAVGSGPQAVAINPVTNRIYVANYYSNNVTVIDGATNKTTKVGAGTQPQAIAVNPLTN